MTDHERGIAAAKNILLLRAHELSAHELAEAAISAYLSAVEQRIMSALSTPPRPDRGFMPKFSLRDRVSKKSGSSWNGHVVGFYSTELTPVGYCVESEREHGSVQIYPETALEFAPDPHDWQGGSDD